MAVLFTRCRTDRPLRLRDAAAAIWGMSVKMMAVSIYAGDPPQPHQIREAIKRRDRDGETLEEIGRSYNVSHSTISRLRA